MHDKHEQMTVVIACFHHAGVMVASDPPVLVREIIPTPKDACEFPHVRSRLQGVKVGRLLNPLGQ
jgi:hypothetical protein